MKFENITYIFVYFSIINFSTTTIPPTLNATGNQIYNPRTNINIATSFTITPELILEK